MTALLSHLSKMSRFQIKKYSNEDHQPWDDFVKNSLNGTIFHERDFINYHPKDRFNDHSLLFFEKEKLIAVFPAAIIKKENSLILKSHPGTSYGGLVFNRNLSLNYFFDLLKELEEYSLRHGFNLIEFREAPKIFNKYPIDQYDFALLKNQWIRESEELSTCYYLPDFKGVDKQELIQSFDNSTLTKARQGIKKSIKNNCEFIELDKSNIEDFHRLLTENLKKHKTKPVHSVDELIVLFNSYPHRVKLFGIKHQDKIIAAMLLFNINNNGWHIFYSALDYSHKQLRPVHLLIFNLIDLFSNQGYNYLNYGISTEDGGNIINWDLFRFKESFNGHGIIRTYWQKRLND